MQIRILLIAISAIAFAGCNSAYKSGQTPDDVYFSPSRLIVQEAKQEKERPRDEIAVRDSYEEREIRMRIRDRRWRELNNDYACNCSCDYTPYKYGYGYGYYYNPYYYPVPVYFGNVQSVNPKLTPVRAANLGSYSPVLNVKSVNPKNGNTEYIRKERVYNNSNNTQREVYAPANNRTYSPSNNSSNNSSSNNSPGSGQSVPRRPRN